MKQSNNKIITLISIGVGIGLSIGCTTGILIGKHQYKRPNQILNQVKAAFLAEGPIEGSWIEMHKMPLDLSPIYGEVYYGGITRYEDNELIQYEFVADAKTGAIIDLYRL